MSFVSLHGISIAFGGSPLLDGVSLNIQQGQRISFLGRYGAGKSTLMKILAGEVIPDAGDIVTAPGVRIAYLPQEIPEGLSGSLFEIVAAGAGKTGEAINRMHRLTHEKGNVDQIHQLHQFLADHDGWKTETAINRALEQVQLEGAEDFSLLSGGMRRRALLARALVCEPDLLLLDEPTNHLDIDSITWIERFILGAKLTVLFVTHDRRFLKRIATRIIELDRGKLVDWSCDYETFLARKQAVLDAEEAAWAQFDKKLAQEEAWIRRGIRARRTRNEGRVRALIRLRDERRQRRERSGAVAMEISTAGRSGNRVLEAKNISFSYDEKPLVSNLSTTIMRGDRIGILGPNGCGKTTLINLLLGKLELQSGTLTFGTNLAVAYFDQLRAFLDPEKSVWENVAADGRDTVLVNGTTRHIISYLQDFLFTSDRAKSPVKQLSGGERNRLMLARMFTQPANLLIFDEPTNDLDTETLELLEELLLEYQGTVLVVSHDRQFLNNVVTTTLVFEGNGIIGEYVGGYDDWERLDSSKNKIRGKKEQDIAEKSKQNRILSENSQPAGPKRLSYKETRELQELPHRIEQLEKELQELNIGMADPALYGKPGFINDAKERIIKLEQELSLAYVKWEELEGRAK
jgi:ABC transport system ATP-binding/permease protein